MKKKFVIALVMLFVIVLVLMLTACNKQLIDLDLKYTRAYIKIGEEWRDVEIKSWKDYDNGEQLQIKLNDDTVILTSSINCILYNGRLPK